MKTLLFLKSACEYLGGLGETPPVSVPGWLAPWLWGAWWAFLTGLIILFCGQTSKFLYIDF